MLQILGWLGCLMLAVKLVELGYSPTLRSEEGRLNDYALMLLVIGWIGAFGFAFWIFAQGQEMRESYDVDASSYQTEAELRAEKIDCLGAQIRGERLGETC